MLMHISELHSILRTMICYNISTDNICWCQRAFVLLIAKRARRIRKSEAILVC